MGKWVIQGDDATTIPPDPQDYVPGAKSKWVPTKAANGNDGGALWWDHDDPGQPGHQGEDGYPGAPGRDRRHGRDSPHNYKLFIPPDTDTTLTLVLGGGTGEPGARWCGRYGGRGQNGGDGDDEQPPGEGGKGETGVPGGVGGLGGKGGTAYDVDVALDGTAKWSNIIQQTHQGFGARGGDGGGGGPGGAGGKRGDNGPQAPNGDAGPGGPTGPRGADGHLGRFHLL